MERPIHILHLEDDAADAELVQARLDLAGLAYKLLRVQTGVEFSQALNSGGYDIILADYNLPGYDGHSALMLVQEHCPEIPFIFVSGALGEDTAIECLTQGATDYVLKRKLSRLAPAIKRALRDAENRRERKAAEAALQESELKFRDIVHNIPGLVFQMRVRPDGSNYWSYISPRAEEIFGLSADPNSADWSTNMEIQHLHPDDRKRFATSLAQAFTQRTEWIFEGRFVLPSGEVKWFQGIASPSQVGNDWAIDGLLLDITGRKCAEESLYRAYETTLEGWSAALDLRDKETEGHTQRVTEMTMKLARVIGLSETEIVNVRRGALLHDIGKMGIPDDVLLKPGNLTDEEWTIMRMHPVYAYQLLNPIEYLRPALDIPYCHHEKWDGTGYPRGLKGEQIPLAARIFAIVDVWDALTSDRPYRHAWTREKALAHILEQSGTHFEPRSVKAFLKLIAQENDANDFQDMPWSAPYAYSSNQDSRR